MDISVIIVTYNAAEYIRACLDSVCRQEGVELEILIVDNASADDTTRVVREYIGAKKNVRLFANRENIGFGRANNQAFAASTGQFVYLLNPDAQLEPAGALKILREQLERHPEWGVAGTRILQGDGQEELGLCEHYQGQEHVRHRDFSKLPGRRACVLGASMFFSRRVFAEMGGFDEDYFLYQEEADLCLRLREKGHEIGFVPEVTIRHIGEASERGCDPYETWRRRAGGMLLFWKKNYPAADARRLAEMDRKRSWFKMISYGWLARFQPANSSAWRKHRKYRAIWEQSRNFLEQLKTTGGR
jgi:N-acetylglucosaminyl-diphospho-decaprenol L-rhamnosyltransferase